MRFSSRFFVALAAAVSLAAACDDGREVLLAARGPAPAASSAPPDLWPALCERVLRCAVAGDSGNPAAARENCLSQEECFDEGNRADFLATYLGCVLPRACDADLAPCLSAAMTKLAPSPDARQFASACAARVAACPGAVTTPASPCDDPDGLDARYAPDANYAAKTKCLSETCDRLVGCLDEVRVALTSACTIVP